jgi:hypothetical protein
LEWAKVVDNTEDDKELEETEDREEAADADEEDDADKEEGFWQSVVEGLELALFFVLSTDEDSFSWRLTLLSRPQIKSTFWALSLERDDFGASPSSCSWSAFFAFEREACGLV